MPERVVVELKRHLERSSYAGDDDLVFCHPEIGSSYDASKMRKRFEVAVKAADIRSIRFRVPVGLRPPSPKMA